MAQQSRVRAALPEVRVQFSPQHPQVAPVSKDLILGFLLAAAGSHDGCLLVCAFEAGSHCVSLAGIQGFSFPRTLTEMA